MPQKIRCECGRVLVVSDRAGSFIRCPKCARQVPVPGVLQPPPVPPASPRNMTSSRWQEQSEPEPPPIQRPLLPQPSANPQPTSAKTTVAVPPPLRRQAAVSEPPPLRRQVPEPVEESVEPPPAPEAPQPQKEGKGDEQPPSPPSPEPAARKPAGRETASELALPSPATSEAAAAGRPELSQRRDDTSISGPPARRRQPPGRPRLPVNSPASNRLARENSDPALPSHPAKDVLEKDESAKDGPPKIGPTSRTPPLRPKQRRVGEQQEPVPRRAAAPSRGVEVDRSKRTVARYLSGAIVFVASFGMAPAVIDVIDHLRFIDQSTGVSRWALVVFLLGALQLAYAFYLVQLPDWSTVWVVTLATLVLAALYAMMLGMATAGDSDSQLLVSLQLSGKLAGGKLAGWCLIMFSLSGLLAYFSGRASVAWHRSWVAMAATSQVKQ